MKLVSLVLLAAVTLLAVSTVYANYYPGYYPQQQSGGSSWIMSKLPVALIFKEKTQ